MNKIEEVYWILRQEPIESHGAGHYYLLPGQAVRLAKEIYQLLESHFDKWQSLQANYVGSRKMRVVVKCLNCGIKWVRVTAWGMPLKLTEDLQYNCPACGSNWYEELVDEH